MTGFNHFGDSIKENVSFDPEDKYRILKKGVEKFLNAKYKFGGRTDQDIKDLEKLLHELESVSFS